MGHGRPVDQLDGACKTHKECLKCARKTHGEICIGEFTKYKYGEKNGDKFCRNKEGSCHRDLCMCDLAFAKAHVGVVSHFDKEYHRFWSITGWNPTNTSEAGVTGGHPTSTNSMKCCQTNAKDSAFVLYNINTKVCCVDGSIGNMGDQC